MGESGRGGVNFEQYQISSVYLQKKKGRFFFSLSRGLRSIGEYIPHILGTETHFFYTGRLG